MTAAAEPSPSPDTSGDDLAYAYKASLLGAAREFRLTGQGLAWQIGRLGGRIGYDQVRRVRLSFRPVTLQHHRFLTEIWPVSGPKLEISSTSWKSMVEQERVDGPYRAFVAELHRRLAAANSTASFETGSPAVLYWPGVVVFSGAALAMAGLIVRAVQTGALVPGLFVAGFLALFLWQAGSFFRRNKPSRYRPDAIPPQVLP
jgi:hypothetical protein